MTHHHRARKFLNATDATARMQERAEFPRAAGARSLLRECKRRKVASSQQKADNVSLTGFVAGRGGVKLRPVELSPLADGAIDSGIELEQSDHQFLHHGLHLDAGTWRVLQVRKSSCCVRQGTCGRVTLSCRSTGFLLQAWVTTSKWHRCCGAGLARPSPLRLSTQIADTQWRGNSFLLRAQQISVSQLGVPFRTRASEGGPVSRGF